MKIIKLVNLIDRPEAYLQADDKDFDLFIVNFKYWRDNYINISLFDYLKSKGIECNFLECDLVIAGNCSHADLNF